MSCLSTAALPGNSRGQLDSKTNHTSLWFLLLYELAALLVLTYLTHCFLYGILTHAGIRLMLRLLTLILVPSVEQDC